VRRLLLLAVFALVLAVPGAALAKGGEPTRATWLTIPDGQRPGGPGWLARVRIAGEVAPHPEVRVRDEETGELTQVEAVPDGAGTWAARVRFHRAGVYMVWLADYDPHDPWRIHDAGPAVRIADPRPPPAWWFHGVSVFGWMLV
jgi:hypothetical protein